ncbi:MAG: hypothetical protein ACREJ3_03960, partial [Polyangiaceae bacterium]
ADPLNLVGILTPGDRVAAITKSRVLYRDGVPVAVREGGVTRIVDRDSMSAKAEIEQRLVKLPNSGARANRARAALTLLASPPAPPSASRRGGLRRAP